MDLDATIRDLAPRLLRYGLARTGNSDLAAEIAQDSLAALVRRWRANGAPESADAFTFAIARRRAGRLMWRRRVMEPLDRLAGLHDSAPDAEAQAAARAEHVRLRKALAKLGPRDREVLLMVAVAEVPQAEAATALGISVSGVKMRLHRARVRLAELMNGGGPHDR